MGIFRHTLAGFLLLLLRNELKASIKSPPPNAELRCDTMAGGGRGINTGVGGVTVGAVVAGGDGPGLLMTFFSTTANDCCGWAL